MSANEPNKVPMSTYDKVRNSPSGPPTRGHDDVATVVGVPGTTVMAVSLPGMLEVEVVGLLLGEGVELVVIEIHMHQNNLVVEEVVKQV